VERVNSPEEKLAAAMHDLLEDTSLTAENLGDVLLESREESDREVGEAR
jgi:hypothetical protein